MPEPRADILAFGAHPDDVEIGAGGAIAAATARGESVVVVDLTRGERASAGDPETRAREAARAAAILGDCARVCLGLPDAALENDDAARLRVLEVVRLHRPRIVLAPAWQDRHPDHHAAAMLVRDACHLAGIAKIGSAPAFRPRKIYHYPLHEAVDPDLVLDVSAVWHRKWEAIQAFESQVARGALVTAPRTSLNDGAFLRTVEARALVWGAMIGVRYGEAFMCHGPVPVRTLPAPDGDDWTAYSVP